MFFQRFVCLTLIFASLFTLSPAQTSPAESNTEKEKAQKELEKRVLGMLDQAVGDAASLKLAQNRAIVYAIAGDLYWKFDEKRAREFFRDAANDIIVDIAEAEKESKSNDSPYAENYIYSSVRYEVLPLVAKHDGELALELLVLTRPAKLAAELAKALLPNAKKDSSRMNYDPAQDRVREEIGFEQRLAFIAAEQNTDKAIKLLKDSLSKGISWSVLPLLQKLNKKDAKKASSLADDVVRKIIDTDLTKNREDFSAAVGFLQYATNPNTSKTKKEKQFKFTETQLKDIASKIADTFLQPSNSIEMTLGIIQVIPSMEKITPEKAALLKQKQVEAMKNLPAEFKRYEQRGKLWNQNSTPEEMIAELPKLNEYEKIEASTSIVDKILQIEDEARARKLIEQIPNEKARAHASEQFESAKISRTAKEGKLNEAKKLIGNLSKKKTQIQKLVALAKDFHKKNTEKDFEAAANLMKDAKALTNEFPEDEDELNDLMEVVKGYAIVNPNEAFRIFDPIVDQINEIVQATAVLSKYNKRNENFKKGELVMSINSYAWEGLLLFRYIEQIQMLGKADLNRMSSFSDKFTRNDTRTIVKLFIAQGFLKEEKKDEDKDSNAGEF
jgi:hypothetical protein